MLGILSSFSLLFSLHFFCWKIKYKLLLWHVSTLPKSRVESCFSTFEVNYCQKYDFVLRLNLEQGPFFFKLDQQVSFILGKGRTLPHYYDKAKLLKEGIFFLIHLFARDILLMKKLEIEETKTT